MEKPNDVSERFRVSYYPEGVTLNVTKNIATRVYKRRNKYIVGYLDDDEIYNETLLSKDNPKLNSLENLYIGREYDYCFCGTFDNVFKPVGEEIQCNDNLILHNRILHKLQIGDHVSKLHEYAANTYLAKSIHREYTELERLFQKIERPMFVGEQKYFDYIKISVRCATYVTKQDIIDNKHYLVDMILEKLQSDRKFRKYEVSVTLLSIANIVLTRDKRVEFTLELKPELRQVMQA